MPFAPPQGASEEASSLFNFLTNQALLITLSIVIFPASFSFVGACTFSWSNGGINKSSCEKSARFDQYIWWVAWTALQHDAVPLKFRMSFPAIISNDRNCFWYKAGVVLIQSPSKNAFCKSNLAINDFRFCLIYTWMCNCKNVEILLRAMGAYSSVPLCCFQSFSFSPWDHRTLARPRTRKSNCTCFYGMCKQACLRVCF